MFRKLRWWVFSNLMPRRPFSYTKLGTFITNIVVWFVNLGE